MWVRPPLPAPVLGQGSGRKSTVYYVYVLKSKRDGQLYIGMTSNLDRRLHQHNTGQTRSIRSRIPFELLFSESFEDRTTARTR
ncbi:MAG: GIY-YIG nuclease family protein, partial [Isosphaeraceae bacterium]